MNQAIRIITDSASDIPPETAAQWGIEIKNIPIAVDGKQYYEGRDFTSQEFYQILLSAKEIPSTSRVNASEFLTSYLNAAEEGIRDIIVITINGSGSGTNESAQFAKKQFEADHADLAQTTKIHIFDSRSYSYGIGYPVVEAAKMAAQGKPIEEICGFIRDWVESAEIYLACYTLEFAKKSGRINSAAAFMGELLGLRPVIRLMDGKNDILEKIRGDKNVVPAVCEMTCRALRKGGEYFVYKGMLDEPAEELAKMLTKRLGYPPVAIGNIGPSISINSGPKIVATILRGERRRP